MSEIKPCAHCGHPGALIPHIPAKQVRFYIQCENDGCGSRINSCSTEAEALSAWNTCAAPDIAVMVSALEELVGEELCGDVNPDNPTRETQFYRPCISWATRYRARQALAQFKEPDHG